MGFVGNQLNYLDTMFRIGYAVFLIVRELSGEMARTSIDPDSHRN